MRELKIDEPHPAARSAFEYLAFLSYEDMLLYREAYSSCASSGNHLAEICLDTLNRLLNNKPVSDRNLLGLAWNIKEVYENKDKKTAKNE